MSSGALLSTWHRWRGRLLLIGASLLIVGSLIPFFYAHLAEHGSAAATLAVPLQMLSPGSGSPLTLQGAAAVGLGDPIVIALLGFLAVGVPITATVDERRDPRRERAGRIGRGQYVLLQAGLLTMVATMVALILLGMLVGAAGAGVLRRLEIPELPALFLYGFMLWASFTGFSLAAAVSIERTGWAIALSAVYLLLNYVVAILGSMWTGVAWAQRFSLFHSFRPTEILGGKASPADLWVLVIAALLPIGYSLVFLRPERSIRG